MIEYVADRIAFTMDNLQLHIQSRSGVSETRRTFTSSKNRSDLVLATRFPISTSHGILF